MVGSVEVAEAVTMNLTTRRDQDWWMGQQRLIAGRRADIAVPLPLPVDSAAFIAWRARPGYDLAWTAYASRPNALLSAQFRSSARNGQ
ncbi:hypothetical protein [Mycobacterium sp. GA-2829]|uniref:hypothetical protein n=1 Tax=Mycobacterium sp. GA-2829 TaxID=1772283 RepID=UPI00074053AF|nr:hypothetical protein [Mycobacterium sp. GA-2829]KUI30951.1 hypothetical protein AU194_09035 [Mycobacterium sp. GA-2829]